MLASEDGREAAIDDIFPLGESNREVGAELLDGVGLMDLRHGFSKPRATLRMTRAAGVVGIRLEGRGVLTNEQRLHRGAEKPFQ